MLGLVLAISTVLAPATQPTFGAGVVPFVSRADLARTYLRLERALVDHPPAPDDLPRVSRAYDRAAMQFFTGKHSDAIRSMNELADSLAPDQATVASRVAGALRVRVSPTVALESRPSAMHIKLSPLYSIPLDGPVQFRLQMVPLVNGDPILDIPITIAPDDPPPNLTIQQPKAPAGAYRIRLVSDAKEEFDMGRWFVSDVPLEMLRASNDQRLGGVKRDDPLMFQAYIAARARNALLADKPGEAESARFNADLYALSREVTGEIESLLTGRDPYVNRPGDYWRAFPAGAMQIPARVYVPRKALEDALANKKQLPLVIALHGAGADEAMFMEGYGAGEIKRLADKHGFIVVAPSSYWMTPNPQSFGGIVDSLAMNYPIDRSRVYVIGHSLGAMAAVTVAARHPDDIAGVVLLAGGSFASVTKLPPTLLIAAGLDPIVPIEKLRAAAHDAQGARLPVTFEEMPTYGHSNMPGPALPRAIEWLLSQPPTKP